MIEISETFSSLSEWQFWWASNASRLVSPSIIGRHIVDAGFVEPLTSKVVLPKDISPCEGNWREGIVASGLNSRARAVLAVIEEKVGGQYHHETRIFGTEALSSFALTMRGQFPRYLGSEYGADEVARTSLYPIPHEDLTALTLPSNSFEFVTTNEVLEHVPDIDAALREIARVLVPGGWHVGTVPFAYNSFESVVKARLQSGQVVHLAEPEYHDNPVDPRGSLVFEIPAWDIVDRAKKAGFSRAHMQFLASARRGYVTNEFGVFVFCAQR